MATTITITYTAIAAPASDFVQQICDVYYPANNASRNPVFDGTYYDTNVEGFGEATTLEAFMAQMVAHPGLIAALREAVRSGSYTYDEVTDDDVLYAKELKSALKSQGFEIEITTTEAEEG